MIPKHRISTHPGRILLEEFLIPMKIQQTQLAEHVEVPVQRINELVKGKRGVTPATAWLLAAAFQTTPDFWLNLQTQHDLAKHRPDKAPGGIRARRVASRAATRAASASSTSQGKGVSRAVSAAPTSNEGPRLAQRSVRGSRPASGR